MEKELELLLLSQFTEDELWALVNLSNFHMRLSDGTGITQEEDEEAVSLADDLKYKLPIRY